MIWKTKDSDVVMLHKVRQYVAESKISDDGTEFVYTLKAPDGMIVRKCVDKSRDRIVELHQNLTSTFCFNNGMTTGDIEDL